MSSPTPSAFRDPVRFRADAAHVVDWVARYLAAEAPRPVQPDEPRGATSARLQAAWPAETASIAALLDEFDRAIMPGMTHWGDPTFFGYFTCTNSSAGMLADLLVSATNVSTMKWSCSPAATELEERVMRWLGDAFGLSDAWFGFITEGGSISTIAALAAARDRATGGLSRTQGVTGAPLRVYTSDQVHSSVDKAMITLGMGEANLVKVETDDAFAMRPDALAQAIAADRAAGLRPAAVVATIGTTSTTSVDPVDAIADVCEREGLWLHVDGAYGGNAAILPELRHHFAGVERADSFVADAHKWLMTPLELSCLYVRDREALRRVFTCTPAYLANAEGDAPTDYMDYSVQLGRTFRALKLWMVMRHHGLDGLRATLRSQCAMVRGFAAKVAATPEWSVPLAPPFSTVCLCWAPDGWDDARVNAANLALQEMVNRSGLAFLSRTVLHGRVHLRLAIGHPDTTMAHLDAVWDAVRAHAEALRRA